MSGGNAQKDPPPYPGQPMGYGPPGSHVSYTGSDVNGDPCSIESLGDGLRQEPQGEETVSLVPPPLDAPPPSASHQQMCSDSCDVKAGIFDAGMYYMAGPAGMTMPTAMPAVVTATEQLLGGGRGSRAGSSSSSRPNSRPASRAGSHVGSRGTSPFPDEASRGCPPSYTSPQEVPAYHHGPPHVPPQQMAASHTGDMASATHHTTSMPLMKALPSQNMNSNNSNSNPILNLPRPSPSPQVSPHSSFKSNPSNTSTPPDLAMQLQRLLCLQQQQQQQRLNQPQQPQPARASSVGKSPNQIHYVQNQSQIQGYVQGQSHVQGQGNLHGQGHMQQLQHGFKSNESLQYSHSIRSTKSASPTPIHLANQVPESRQPMRNQRPSTAPATERSVLPPQYAISRSQPVSLRRSYEMLDRLPRQTYSQPDLSRLAGDLHTTQGMMPTSLHHQNTPVISKKKFPPLDHAAIATRATQMVERLSQENLSLRKELETYYNKVCKLQKFEGEIEKVHDAYESLVKHSQKRETLEKAMRNKLEAHIATLKVNQHHLKEQLERSTQQLAAKQLQTGSRDGDYIQQLHQKDALVNKLVMQNRELLMSRERLQLEVEAGRSTLEEQRAQISILDTALTHTQAHSLKYEEELSRRRVEEDKVLALKRALLQFQCVSEKRQEVDAQLVMCLRQEVHRLRRQLDDEEDDDESEDHTVSNLLMQLQQRDEHILQLQSDSLSWEQKYLQMASSSQGILNSTPTSHEARFDHMKELYEPVKLAADAHADQHKHLEELYVANRRAAEAEARLKAMHSQLAEKEAMLRVLQRHPTLSRTASIASLFSSSLHSHHQSILAASSPIPSLSPLSTSPLPSTPCSTYSNLPSGASSRQNSQLDNCNLATFNNGGSPVPVNSHLETTIAVHSKSSSIGSNATAASSASSAGSLNGDLHFREIQMQLAAQAAVIGSLDPTSEQLKKCFWQV